MLIVFIVSICGFLAGCGWDKPQIEAGKNWMALLDKDLSTWDVWTKATEMQIQEGDAGDFHPLVGVSMDTRSSETTEDRPGDYFYGDTQWIYDPTAEHRLFRSRDQFEPNRGRRICDYEKPYGEWNTVEYLTVGGTSVYIVNGQVTMIVTNARRTVNGREVPLTRGKIQVISEWSELYYRTVELRPLKKIPDKYLR